MSILPSKYNQNPITPHCFSCYCSSLSHHHHLDRLVNCPSFFYPWPSLVYFLYSNRGISLKHGRWHSLLYILPLFPLISPLLPFPSLTLLHLCWLPSYSSNTSGAVISELLYLLFPLPGMLLYVLSFSSWNRKQSPHRSFADFLQSFAQWDLPGTPYLMLQTPHSMFNPPSPLYSSTLQLWSSNRSYIYFTACILNLEGKLHADKVVFIFVCFF